MRIGLLAALLLLQLNIYAQTWESLGSPPTSSTISSLHDTLFAATSLNLFFSTDEGTNWTPILTPENAPFMASEFIRPSADLDNREAFHKVESLVLDDVLFFIVTFYTSGTTVSLQRLYRSVDRGQSLELVHATAINDQGGFQLQLPERLEGKVFLLRSEGFANFVGPITDYLISMNNGKTWESNTYAEFQEGAQRTPPFLMDIVEDKILGVESVRTIPFQALDQLTFFDAPELNVLSQKAIPIGLDSFRLRSAFYHDEAAYLFYFRVDHDGTVLLAKTSDLGENWFVSRFILNMLNETAIKDATFHLIDSTIYMESSNETYHRLVEGAPIKLEATSPPNSPILTAQAQNYKLNVLADDELWTTSSDGVFQHIEDHSWQFPEGFIPYPSTQNVTEFRGAYYLLDEQEAIHISADGLTLLPVFQAENVQGITAFDDAIFAFGEQLYFSQDGTNWGTIQLDGVEGKITEVLALEDELVIATDAKQFYFIRNINSTWESINIGNGDRAIALDETTSKLYIYELPSSDLDTDINIYEKTAFGDDEWIGQGASLFGELYPANRFKLLFHQDQIIKLDIADERLFISDNGGFSWEEEAPELGQLIDIAFSESYCYLATRNNGVYRTDLNKFLKVDTTQVQEEGIIDLALFMTVDKPLFKPFDDLVYTISVLNSGPDTAKNISVRFFDSPNSDGLAYVESVTTKGNTRGWDNLWRNIELAPRERATLKLTYFARRTQPLTLFAEVLETVQIDSDSEPDNFSTYLTNEDDEAQVTAYPENQSSLVNGSFFQGNESALHVFPTAAHKQVRIQVQQMTQSPRQIRILNSAGQQLVQNLLSEDLSTIDVDITNFPKGTYFVQLIGQNKILEKHVFFKL